MEQQSIPGTDTEAESLSPWYRICMVGIVFVVILGIALALPYVIEFAHKQMKNISIKTHSALRYP